MSAATVAGLALAALSIALLTAGLAWLALRRMAARLAELGERIAVVQRLNRDLRNANTRRGPADRESETLPHRAARPDPDLGRWADQLRDDTAALDAELRRLLEP